MCVFKPAGVACAGLWGPLGSAAAGLASDKCCVKVKRRGRRTGVGESPVTVSVALVRVTPSSVELVEFRVNLAGPPVKPKYSLVTDSGSVP